MPLVSWAFARCYSSAIPAAASALPLGENENGLSDPSVLTEIYHWNLLTVMARYRQLGNACLALLAMVYVTDVYVRFSSLGRQVSLRE